MLSAMRGFLIFLACAIPIMLMSPYFWSLVRMEPADADCAT